MGGSCMSDHHHHLHQSLNRQGRWGTTDDFATSFLHFPLFSTCVKIVKRESVMMMTVYRVRIYPCCNSMLFALERPQSSSGLFLSPTVRARSFCVAMIHRTLTWTTGSLTCAHMFMHAIAHGGVRTPKESLHWKLTLGRKSLAAPGNRTCVSGVTVRCSNQLSYIPTPKRHKYGFSNTFHTARRKA